MIRLVAREVPSRSDRPGTQLLHDSAHVRIVGFHLLPGQEVKAHRSSSTVTVQVVDGEGVFTGVEGNVRLIAGEAVVYDPEEVHAIRALEVPLRFLAIMSPRPE